HALAQTCAVIRPRYLDRMIRSLTYALLLSATALPAMAETRAIVIGVSDYLVLDADLKGPSHDAQLIAETLVARGVEPAEIAVLASDPPLLPEGVSNARPTRAAIMAAMEDVAA